MKLLYKTVMFLTLLIFCVGSVCATDPDNTTSTNLTDNQKVNNGLDTIITTCNLLKEDNAKQAIEIQNLKDNNTQLDKRVKALEDSNKVLTDSNKVLTDRVQALEYSRLTQSNRIKSLEIDIKNLEDSNKQLIDSNKQLVDCNKALNVKIDNQSVIINSLKTDNEALNAKLDLQVNEIKGLQADKDKLNAEINKLNAEIKENYKKLLSSPKREDFDQLKKEIDNKNKQIDKLNNEISTLKAVLSVSKNDVYNSLKGLSSTKNIKCGKYTFKLEDYLKIPLIKNGKKNVLKYKKDNGRLPNYVTIAGYDVSKKVYKKIYNIK